MRHVRLGVVGAGYWGPNLIRNCYDLGVLDAVCDIDNEALSAVRQQYPGVATVQRFEELLARPISGVVLCTPAQLHARMALKAIASGKNVFVEKPLALTVAEGERIAEAAETQRLVVFVGHLLLYHPAVQQLRSLLAQGAIGQVWHVRSRRLSLGKLRDHENVWWSFAPHDIALMLAIMGEEPSAVTASQSSAFISNISDVAYADFVFTNGRSAHIEVCWLDFEKTARVDVFGSRGVITLRDSRAGSELSISDFDVEQTAAGRAVKRGATSTIPVPSVEPLRAELLAFLASIETGRQPETSARQGVAVLRSLAMASDASAKLAGLGVL